MALATTTGLRWGRIKMPVPSLIVSVRAATNVSQISGSGMGMLSPPGILPLLS